MALLTQNGNYVKATRMTTDQQSVEFIIFKDAEQRSRYPEQLSEFEQYKLDTVYVPHLKELLNAIADGEKSVQANILTACYLAMKQDSRFAESQDI